MANQGLLSCERRALCGQAGRVTRPAH